MIEWISAAFRFFVHRSIASAFVFAFCDFLIHEFINLSMLYKCKVKGGVNSGS